MKNFPQIHFNKDFFTFFLCLFPPLFMADFLLKFWVVHYVQEPIFLGQVFSGVQIFIQYVTNTGAAWGIFSNFSEILLIFRICIIVGILLYVLLFCRAQSLGVALIVCIVGSLCNVFDSLYYGHVVDMLHFIFWGRSYGIFNLADVYISLGCLFLIGTILFSKKKDSIHGEDSPTHKS